MIWSATTGHADGGHIVLVHGTLDRSAGLLKLSRRLDDRYLVTRFDRRGYGRSRPHDGPFGMVHQVDDLVDVIASAPNGRRPRVVVGHSYGGNVALALAARHPDTVDGVVTYESPMSWRPWWPGTMASDGTDTWDADPEAAAERFVRRLIGDHRWDRLPASTRRARRAEGVAMVGELRDLADRPPWRSEEIAVPVLAMHGARGRDQHRRAAETIANEVADGASLALAEASHPGPNTHPDATAFAIEEFVRRRVRSC